MSLAWRGSLVLWREPVRAVAMRLASRALLPLIAAAGWAFDMPTWANVVLSIAALPSALLLVFGVINVARNRRAQLVHMGSGSIERPRSTQEVLLKRPVEYVAGEMIAVRSDSFTLGATRTDPRVTLLGGGAEISRMPLYGVEVEEFVATVNALLEGRGTRLEVVTAPDSIEIDLDSIDPPD